MLSNELIKNLKKYLNSTIITICYIRDNVVFNAFYTKNKNYIKKNTSIKRKSENFITAWNLISETWDNIYYNEIQNFEYASDKSATLYINLIEKNKKSLKDLNDLVTTKNIINNITNYVNDTCNHSITINDVFTCLKTRNILNISLNDEDLCDFVKKTIGMSKIEKILFLFLNIGAYSNLEDENNLNYFKEKYINLINSKIEEEKIKIEEEFNKLKSEFTDLNSDEIVYMKEYLDTIKNDYSIFDGKSDIKDICLNSWPTILAPNPFELLLY